MFPMKEESAEIIPDWANMFSMKQELAGIVPDWANILDDLLRYIADMTHSVLDRIHMGAVCRSWQASLIDKRSNFPVCLMLAEKQDSDKRCFYNISEEIFIELELPEVRGRRCWGTAFGWLVTCGLDLKIQLFNPLSRASLPLPSVRTFTHMKDRPPKELCKFNIDKLILSSSPASSDCIVLAIYSEYCLLGFARPGDQAWTRIDNIRPVFDAIYFNGNFFACKQNGQLFICEDLCGSHPRAVEFAPPSPADDGYMKYLFDLGGNLCLASRIIIPDVEGDYINEPWVIYENNEYESDTYITVEFEIFKLDMHTRSWEKIYSLGDRSLFLGNCNTFAIMAADYPGCRPNCIYFTDDNPVYYDTTGGSDMGIYDCIHLNNVEEEEVDEEEENNDDEEEVDDYVVEPFPKSEDVQDLRSSLSPPLWIIPFSR